jgi:hypothetical protein
MASVPIFSLSRAKVRIINVLIKCAERVANGHGAVKPRVVPVR